MTDATSQESHSLEPLKIKALDEEDLAVIAAFLQDAIIPLAGMRYEKDKGRFYLVANRFCWECHPQHAREGSNFHRVQSGALFDHVKAVQKQGMSDHPDTLMNLLTLHNTKEGCVQLVFSGGAHIQLEIEKLSCKLKDLEEPYLTSTCPSHED